MIFSTRLKFTVAAGPTSAASLSDGVAVALGRNLARAIADGVNNAYGLKIGSTNMMFEITDGANWEESLFTVGGTASAPTLTRTAVLASSAGGTTPAVFSGPLTVYSALGGYALNTGLINPADPGFDIILCAGQSNMVGQDVPNSALDIPDPRVFSFGGYAVETATYQQITQAVDPLRFHYSQTSLPNTGNGAGMSPAQWFAKTYAGMIPSNRKVLLVPVAQNATYLVAQTAEWAPGDTTSGGVLYENAIAQGNAALAAAQKMYPASRVVGTIWLQGEGDAAWTISQINYAAALKTLIQGFRNRITGAANSWFIILGMIGEYVSLTDPGSSSGYPVIDAAHQQVAAEFPHCAYTKGITGYPFAPSTVHYNVNGARIMGCNAAGVLTQALQSNGVDTTAPVILRASVSNATPNKVAVTLSEPFNPNYPTQASAWTVTGHTVSSASGVGNVVYLTLSTPFVNGENRTVSFTAPGNDLRDLAGNLMTSQSGVSITDSVAANATAVTLTGPTSGTAGQVSSAFTVGVSPVGSNINGTLAVTISDGTNSNTFNLTNASPTATFTETEATAGTYTISATNNGGLTNPANISYVVSAATGPVLSSAQVANAAPTVVQFTMSAALGASVPPTSAFSITENGAAKTVSSVSVSGSVASVTVSSAFSNGTAIQATYTQPGANPRLQDGSGNPAPSFGPVTVTNNVAAAAAGTALRFGSMINMTETSATAPYAYKEGTYGNYDGSNNGATSNLALAGDGSITVQITSVSAQPMLSLKNISPTAAYNNAGMVATLFGASSGYKNIAGLSTVTVNVSNRVPAEGDYIKLVRSVSAGTITASVSSDGGNTWTQIFQTTSVPSGTLYAQIQATTNGTFTNPTGTGWA